MPEEIQGASQSTEGQQIEGQQQTQQQTPPSTPQEGNFFEIKYNKEPVKVSYDEAPTYIQKGMNYDKVQQKATEYEQQMGHMAQLLGYQTQDELLNAMNEFEQQQKAEQEQQLYQQAGVDPDTFNQLLSNHPAIQYANQMQQQQQENQRLSDEWGELANEFPGITPEQIQPEVFQTQAERGLSLLDAYLRVNYKSLGQQKEQEAIQKLQNNALSSPGSLGAGGEHQTKSVNNMSKTEFENMIQRVKRGERVEL